jgi:hypothetical protein
MHDNPIPGIRRCDKRSSETILVQPHPSSAANIVLELGDIPRGGKYRQGPRVSRYMGLMSTWGPDHGAVSAGLALFFQAGGAAGLPRLWCPGLWILAALLR